MFISCDGVGCEKQKKIFALQDNINDCLELMRTLNFSNYIINLLSLTTAVNPTERCTINDIMNHKFFNLKSIFENQVCIVIPEFK